MKSSYDKKTFLYFRDSSLSKYFFILILIELFLMGSGRSLEFGSLTLRMLFYAVAVTYTIVIYLNIYKIKVGFFLLRRKR